MNGNIENVEGQHVYGLETSHHKFHTFLVQVFIVLTLVQFNVCLISYLSFFLPTSRDQVPLVYLANLAMDQFKYLKNTIICVFHFFGGIISRIDGTMAHYLSYMTRDVTF